jgi:hypothetical protein
MNPREGQAELFGLVWRPYQARFRLRVNDVIRIGDRLGRVIRVNECAAVVLINQPARQFTTRFDRHVSFQPAPILIRISVNSEAEIINRKRKERRKK